VHRVFFFKFSAVRFVQDGYSCDHSRHQVEQKSGPEEQNESAEGSAAHTVVEKRAVVVESPHAVVAARAMRGFGQALDVARWAITILVEARLFINQRLIAILVMIMQLNILLPLSMRLDGL